MLGSEHAAERASAALIVERQRARLNLTWDDLIVPAEVEADLSEAHDGAADQEPLRVAPAQWSVSVAASAFDHPAIMSGRTIFPGTVRPARSSDRWALKRGEHSRKIGDEILKSKWKGFPVWTLTLRGTRDVPAKLSSLAILLRQQDEPRGSSPGGAGS